MAGQYSTDLTRSAYPYAGDFASLLPLGVVHLDSFHGLPGPAPTAPDGWNWAPPLPWISSRRGTFESELEYLSEHDFIRATYQMEGNGCAKVRIYVSPEDCQWYLTRESRVELRGRALLQKLWGKVDIVPEMWQSEEGEWKYPFPYRSLLVADDDVSLNLSSIFNSLPSPKPDPAITDQTTPIVKLLLESVLEDDGVPGFKSQLYEYQRESVWKMLQRELLPQKRPDPRLRRWIGPTGIQAWVNTDDMTFFRKQQYVPDVRGGILCEEMGTGKTCICLALIVLTVHQRALPPPEATVSSSKPKSLYQRCFDTVINQGIPFRHLDPRPHFYSDLENAMPSYTVKQTIPLRSRRREFFIPSKTVYLSTATLVVVPDTLIQQWSTEILKHVQDDILSCTIVSKATQALPSAEELMKTDILLLSHSRFAREDDNGPLDSGYPGCMPQCWKTGNCTCRSPLTQIRWKRLIIDEGHILGKGNSRLVSLAGRLYVDRRWCVTGTVSDKLMGMDLGMDRPLSADPTNTEEGILTPPEDSDEGVSRKSEQLDLRRFGLILIDFLHAPPFYNAEIWNRYVVKPYTENLRGSMTSLRSMMSLMIRHRPEDIEQVVQLPPIHIRTVLLQPTPENRMSINVITALIASNAVLSQREHQDYFFHPSQTKARDEVVHNVMLAAFHFTGTTMFRVMRTIENVEEGLRKAGDRGYSAADVTLLEKALAALKEAMENEAWRTLAVQKQAGLEEYSPQEMAFMLEKCPSELVDKWELPPVDNPLSEAQSRETHLFSGPALLSMKSQLPNLVRRPDDEHISYLLNVGDFERHKAAENLRKMQEERIENSKNKDGSPRKASTIKSQNESVPQRNDEEQKLRKVVQHETNHYDLSKPNSPQKRPRAPQPLTPPSTPPVSNLKSILKHNIIRDDISESSPLKPITIKRTASAKLNYLLKQIQTLHKDEKIIVFSDYWAVMWYLGEALEILGIEHMIYIQRLMPQRRSHYIVTFNSSPHYRVLIMETKVAAHGLNVTAASRVFFLNPCWQRSVERQAIKRAHRIGQQREVFVETLILKDTIEEELMIRREEMGKEQLDRTKRFTDDGKLRNIISSAKFVPEYEEEAEYSEIGHLFEIRGRTTEEIDKELIIEDDDKVSKKRKAGGKGDEPQAPKLRRGENSSKIPMESNSKSGKLSKVVTLKIPKQEVLHDIPVKKQRRVQFAE